MNLYSLFQDFNPSKFLVYAALFLFSLLFALKLDGVLTSSYWAIFTPLWVWKAISIVGCILGCVAWVKTLSSLSASTAAGAAPNHRHQQGLSRELVIQFRAMLFSTALNVLLLAFELLLCYNLEADESRRVLWVVVVSPLVLLSITAIGIGVWSIRHGRSFDFEIFCSVNILEFIFVALKLDGFVDWSWIIVFIPIFSTMCIFGIAIIYLLLLICILSRSLDTPHRRYRHQLCVAIAHLIILPPLLTFEVCLALKLDERMPITYTAAVFPLLFAFLILMFMSCNGRGFNVWWCGIKRDFLSCILHSVTPLQEYANISWQLADCFLSVHSESDDGSNPPFAPASSSFSRALLTTTSSAGDTGIATIPAVSLMLDAPE